MENRKFRPLYDKLFWFIWIPTLALMIAVTLVNAIIEPFTLFFTLTVDAFVFYFLASPLSAYVEFRSEALFIKFGFILKREIPYRKIRAIKKERKFYSESMLSLKNAFEHVNIKYNSFDVVTVSVKTNDEFILALRERLFALSPLRLENKERLEKER